MFLQVAIVSVVSFHGIPIPLTPRKLGYFPITTVDIKKNIVSADIKKGHGIESMLNLKCTSLFTGFYQDFRAENILLDFAVNIFYSPAVFLLYFLVLFNVHLFHQFVHASMVVW